MEPEPRSPIIRQLAATPGRVVPPQASQDYGELVRRFDIKDA